jgi:AraC family transcriptional regulator
VLGDALCAVSAERESTRAHGRIPDVQRRLATELELRVSLDELAEIAGCSRWRLSRVFHERMGVGIAAYRRRLQLRAALVRILEGSENFTQVALDTGFSSHSYLSTSIRREFGCSPRDLRRD